MSLYKRGDTILRSEALPGMTASKVETKSSRCPSCGGHLPLLLLFKADPVACPHCSTELERNRWITAPALAFSILIMNFGPQLARSAGFVKPFDILLTVCLGTAAWFLLAFLLTRYRMATKPLSILG